MKKDASAGCVFLHKEWNLLCEYDKSSGNFYHDMIN